jgi:sialidase-1
MLRIDRMAAALALVVVFCSTTERARTDEPRDEAPRLGKTDLFRAGEGGYFMYRIPGVVVTGRGTILAYCEARAGQGDWTPQDVLLRRSVDGGRTWSKPRKMAVAPPDLKPNPAGVKQGLTEPGKLTAHNAVAVPDLDPDVVHFIYHVESARVF